MKEEPPGSRRTTKFAGRLISWFLAASLLFAVYPAEARPGHTATTTLLRNQEYAEELLKRIGKARENIVCSFYLFKITDRRGNQPRRIADALIEARTRGVPVTVILERGRSSQDRLYADNRATADLLSRGGVRVYFASPGVTTHNKIVVIDDRYIFLGSHNLTQGALKYNNELSVLIDSPEMAAEVRSYLERE
ncbi:MAG TPA: phospholipase D-like domain-containing protein [Geobacteraceae bacterium]|nr:phospholipase D-like domain-containing protein [Geobacteraceae bacterium]